MPRGLSDRELMLTDFDRLNKDIKRLKSEKGILIRKQNEQAVKLSDLVQKGIEAKAEAEKIVSDAKIKADGIVAKAKERASGIVKLESELKGKIADAEEAKRQADNLIKSNEGKEKNLLAAKETNAEIKAKLTKVLGMIKDVI